MQEFEKWKRKKKTKSWFFEKKIYKMEMRRNLREKENKYGKLY